MEFNCESKENCYTVMVEGKKMASILVECKNSCHREFYQRGPVKLGLAISNTIFEETVLAFFRYNLKEWVALYGELELDSYWGQDKMEETIRKYYR